MNAVDMTFAAAGGTVVLVAVAWWRSARRRRRRIERARLRSQLAALRRHPGAVDPGAYGRMPGAPPDAEALRSTWGTHLPTSSLSAHAGGLADAPCPDPARDD